jgi:hypothetical protein
MLTLTLTLTLTVTVTLTLTLILTLRHANASRIFDSYIATVGHGAVLNMNIPPTASGRMNASVVAVMAEAGRAINETFKMNNAGGVAGVSGQCKDEVAVLEVSGEFDYIVTMEDLTHGQRIGNYSIEYRAADSKEWKMLVPPVLLQNSSTVNSPRSIGGNQFGDRPDGNDPRDSHIGHKRIDVPVGVTTSGAGAVRIAEVKFNCIAKVKATEPTDLVYLRSFSLHKRNVPWDA